MISKTIYRMLVVAIIPALAGFVMISRADADQSMSVAGVILSVDNVSGSLSIVPNDSKAKAEYREVLYGMGEGKDKDKAKTDHYNPKSDRDMGTTGNAGKDRDATSSPNAPDRDTGSMGEGSTGSMERDRDLADPTFDRGSSIDPTFHYIIWPFSRDSDKSEKSVDKDRRERERLDGKDYSIDRDKPSTPGSSDLGTTDGKGGMLLVAEGSIEPSDSDMADDKDLEENTDDSSDTMDQPALLLVTAGAGSTGRESSTAGGMSPDRDMGTMGSGSTMGSGTGSMNSDRDVGSNPGVSGDKDLSDLVTLPGRAVRWTAAA